MRTTVSVLTVFPQLPEPTPAEEPAPVVPDVLEQNEPETAPESTVVAQPETPTDDSWAAPTKKSKKDKKKKKGKDKTPEPELELPTPSVPEPEATEPVPTPDAEHDTSVSDPVVVVEDTPPVEAMESPKELTEVIQPEAQPEEVPETVQPKGQPEEPQDVPAKKSKKDKKKKGKSKVAETEPELESQTPSVLGPEASEQIPVPEAEHDTSLPEPAHAIEEAQPTEAFEATQEALDITPREALPEEVLETVQAEVQQPEVPEIVPAEVQPEVQPEAQPEETQEVPTKKSKKDKKKKGKNKVESEPQLEPDSPGTPPPDALDSSDSQDPLTVAAEDNTSSQIPEPVPEGSDAAQQQQLGDMPQETAEDTLAAPTKKGKKDKKKKGKGSKTPEPDPKPEQVPLVEPASAAVPDPVPEPSSELIPEPMPIADVDDSLPTDPMPEPASEPASEPVPEPVPEQSAIAEVDSTLPTPAEESTVTAAEEAIPDIQEPLQEPVPEVVNVAQQQEPEAPQEKPEDLWAAPATKKGKDKKKKGKLAALMSVFEPEATPDPSPESVREVPAEPETVPEPEVPAVVGQTTFEPAVSVVEAEPVSSIQELGQELTPEAADVQSKELDVAPEQQPDETWDAPTKKGKKGKKGKKNKIAELEPEPSLEPAPESAPEVVAESSLQPEPVSEVVSEAVVDPEQTAVEPEILVIPVAAEQEATQEQTQETVAEPTDVQPRELDAPPMEQPEEALGVPAKKGKKDKKKKGKKAASPEPELEAAPEPELEAAPEPEPASEPAPEPIPEAELSAAVPEPVNTEPEAPVTAVPAEQDPISQEPSRELNLEAMDDQPKELDLSSEPQQAEETWDAPVKKGRKDKKKKGKGKVASPEPELEAVSGPAAEPASEPAPEVMAEREPTVSPEQVIAGPEVPVASVSAEEPISVEEPTQEATAETSDAQPRELDITEEPQQLEETWDVPTKKSKKDKKKKGKGKAAAPEPEPEASPVVEAPATEVSAPVALEPETAAPAEVAVEPSSEAVTELALEPSLEPAAEPVTEPVVDGLVEPATETVTEVPREANIGPVLESVTEPVAEPVIGPPVEPATETVTEVAPEPSFETLAEAAPEPVVEPAAETIIETVAEPAAEHATEPAIEAAAEPASEVSQEAQEDTWALPTKKSKKDKKRKGSKQIASEPTPEVETVSPPQDELVAAPIAEPEAIPEPTTRDALTGSPSQETAAADLWAEPTKKSKKGKKKGKQAALEPETEVTAAESEQVLDVPEPRDVSLDEDEAVFGGPSREGGESSPVKEAMPDEAAFALPSKKSKKKKGKKAALEIQESEDVAPVVVEETAIASDPVLVEEAPLEPVQLEETSAPIVPELMQVDDALVSQAPQLEETAALSEPVHVEETPVVPEPMPAEETPALPEPAHIQETPVVPEPVQIEEAPVLEPVQLEEVSTPLVPEPMPVAEALAPESTQLEQTPAPPEPIQIEEAPVVSEPIPVEETPVVPESMPVEEMPGLPEPIPIEETAAVPGPIQLEEPTPRELVEETLPTEVQTADDVLTMDTVSVDAAQEEEIVEYTGKKSKKDKKKKGKKTDSALSSGLGTPRDQEEASVADVLPAAALATAVAAGVALADDDASTPKEAVEEDFGFVGKKGKKDKKKKGKGAAAVVDEAAASSTAETSRDIQEAPAETEKQPEVAESVPPPTTVEETSGGTQVDNNKPNSRPQTPVAEKEKVEIHPAVSEALRQSPILAPATIGLGLIANPPEPYPEDAPSPKLLSALQTPFSLDAQVEAATRQLGGGGVDMTPAQDSSHIAHEPPFGYDDAHRKKIKTRELEATEISAPVVTASEVEVCLAEDRSPPPPPHKDKGREEENREDGAALAAAAVALTGGVSLLAEKFGGGKRKERKEREMDGGVELEKPVERSVDVEEMKEARSRPRMMVNEPYKKMEVEETKGHSPEPTKMEVDEQHEKTVERNMDVEEPTIEREASVEARSVPGLGRMDSETIPRSLRDASGAGEPAKKEKKKRRERTPSPEPVQRAFSFPDDIADEEVFTTREATTDNKKDVVELTGDEPVRLPPLSNFSEFMRSHSSLPPVQEELSDDEPAKTQPRPRPQQSPTPGRRRIPETPELHRDSGFSSGSPHLSRALQDDHEILRDSGVHLRDSAEGMPLSPFRESHHRSLSPRLPEERLAVHTPRNDEAERRFRRSPLSAGQRGVGGVSVGGVNAVGPETPRLHEPSPPPRTPEPEKLHVARKRGPATPAGPSSVASVASVAPLRSPPDSAHAAPRGANTPTAGAPTARRVPSNTSMARLRTPEPALRPDSPGSAASPSPSLQLRRMDKRASGDLRSVSLSQRDLAAKAREQELQQQQQGSASPNQSSASTAAVGAVGAAAVAVVGAAALGALQLQSSPLPATSSTTPIANEGRARAKDMADVFVCFLLLSFSIESFALIDANNPRMATARAASARRAPRRARTACAAARACRCSSSSRASSSCWPRTACSPTPAPTPTRRTPRAAPPPSPSASPRSRPSAACSRRPTTSSTA
jgi:hypothetical protein